MAFFRYFYNRVFSILGGVLGYIIGMYFWDLIGIKIVNFYNAYHHIDYIKSLFNKYGWLVILIAGISPIPYKIFTIGSGMLGYNFIVFLLCSLISRGLRFISLTFLINKYGEKSIRLAEKHFIKLTVGLSFIYYNNFLLIL